MSTQISRQLLAKANILVVGDAMLDRYWHGVVERISPEAPVPVVRVTHEEEKIGGAANVALNVVSLGARASFVGVVGEDEVSNKLENLLRQTGIATYLARDPTIRTTVKLRVIGRAQQLIRVDFENTPQHRVLSSQTQVVAQQLKKHDAVLFSDYGKGGLCHIEQMIASARAQGRTIFIDPKGADYRRYKGATVITPNRSELRQVIGEWSSEEDLEVKVHNLRASLSVDALLLTRSEDGASLYDAQGVVHVKAQAREVFDVTGAGDTVIATLAALACAGLGLREALPYANRAAGIVVGRFGTASVNFAELFEGVTA